MGHARLDEKGVRERAEVEARLRFRRVTTSRLEYCKNIGCAERAVIALTEVQLLMKCFEAPLPDCGRENAPIALNLQVLGRRLAAIGDLFVFDALPFIK